MDCKLEFVYYVTRRQNEYIASHKHECHELVYYIHGTGFTEIEGENYPYSPHHFAVMKAGSVHDEKHTMNTDVLFIGFLLNDNTITIPNGVYEDGRHQPILGYLSKIKQELLDQKKFFRLKLDLLLKELLIEFERIKSTNQKKSNNFSYIIKFMEENFNQQVDLKSLAAISGYSYDHFRHMFKQKTGLSPISYILRCRVENAKKLLQSGMNMQEVSYNCGFSNQSQFCTLFKREVGVTPNSYKRNL